jgi:hypothetical protein
VTPTRFKAILSVPPTGSPKAVFWALSKMA